MFQQKINDVQCMQVAETAGSQSKIKKFIEGHASYLLLTITN